MTATPHAVAHQFDDAAQQRDASALGMWVFLVTEVMFFGGLFTAYVAYRALYPGSFAHASSHLDLTLGTINTAVLIASSLTMALAVDRAQAGQRTQLMLFLALTMLLGTTFVTIKGVEYAHKFTEGLVPGPAFTYGDAAAPRAQIFFAVYFAMTGVHAVHMLIGIAVLGVLFAGARRGRFGPDYYTPVELSGLYWHFVDVVWIFLFPLLYLIGRHG